MDKGVCWRSSKLGRLVGIWLISRLSLRWDYDLSKLKILMCMIVIPIVLMIKTMMKAIVSL